jgi:hypothetical protein
VGGKLLFPPYLLFVARAQACDALRWLKFMHSNFEKGRRVGRKSWHSYVLYFRIAAFNGMPVSWVGKNLGLTG